MKHFPEFLQNGYKPHLGALEVKFPYRDSSRAIQAHSVGFVDGFCKVLCMLAIVTFCKELELSEEELKDPVLAATLQSFCSISCAYNHFPHPGHHYLYSLSSLAFNA